jgi:hypothetical protein
MRQHWDLITKNLPQRGARLMDVAAQHLLQRPDDLPESPLRGRS